MGNLIFEHIGLLFLAFLAGTVIGFAAKLMFRRRPAYPAAAASQIEEEPIADEIVEEPEAQPEEAPEAEFTPESDELELESEAFGLEEPRSGVADDLTKISGIGPKTQELLYDLGVFHFDQIAGWSDVEVTAVDEMLPFRGQIVRDGWVEQAKRFAGIAEEEA